MTSRKFDFVVLGAGIIGLAIARQLKKRHSDSSILVMEKESSTGFHASGRNSGVLHSGLYYPPNTLKAKACARGSKAMASYCEENGLPLKKIGKVIVPTKVEDDSQVDRLFERANSNGVHVKVIGNSELKEIEPAAYSVTGRALYSPGTSVVDPKAILKNLVKNLEGQGVQFSFDSPCERADPDSSAVFSQGRKYQYGHLYNATGQHADRIAKMFFVGDQYILLPFKGRYFHLRSDSDLRINGLIYPVPDLNLPFLGVHSVKTVSGDVYFGPSATPAFGRENYRGFEGMCLSDTATISYHLVDQYRRNKQGFRRLLHEEFARLNKRQFTSAARALVPSLKSTDLQPSDKVGIRAQLLDLDRHELVMDFVIEEKENTTHILNSISPAFTSSFAVAELLLEKSEAKHV